MREPVAHKAIDDPKCGAEIVVEAGPNDACRQRMTYIANILAHLIPCIGNLLCICAAFQVDKNRRDAGLRVATQEVQVVRFLQFSLKSLCNLFERIFHRCSGPCCLNNHGLDDKGGILAASEPEVRHYPRDDGDDHQVGDERTLIEGPLRKIEFHCGLDPSTRLFWPGW